MANTIENTTDEALLRSIIDGSIEGKFEDDTITSLTRDGLFYGCNNLTEVYLPNLTSMNGFSFVPNSASASCTSLKTIDVPNLINFSGILYNLSALKNFNAPKFSTIANSNNAILMYCNSIEKVHLPKAPLCHFYSNNSLKYVVLPNVINVRAIRATHNGVFIALDLGETCTNLNFGGDNIFYQTENNNTEALILRSKTLLPLTRSSLNGSVNTGQGFGNFAKNKIYVPQALVEDYKVATNWSQYASCFEPIEGSKYEHYWADGTPIGFSNNYRLIGFYDVGDSSRYEAIENVPSHINSTVDSELVAYTSDRNTANYGSQSGDSKIPNTFYDGYANYCDLCIYSPTKNFLSDCDVITIEFGHTAITNNDPYIYPVYKCAHKNSITETGTTNLISQHEYRSNKGLSEKTFLHKLLEFHKDGTIKFYVNGEYANSRTVSQETINSINWIGIGHENNSSAYLGPVAIWNRALTEDEIAEHYNYYVDTYHVGELAYDSSGNFIAGS